MITFSKRNDTQCIRMAYRPRYIGMSLDEITKEVRRSGKLNLGFHYVLDDKGKLTKGIDNELFADPELDGSNNSIYVLMLSESLSDSQRHTLTKLSDDLKLGVIY